MAGDVVLPAGARFSCRSCGKCCQGWSVPVDAATVTRLRAHHWGEDPFEPNPGGDEPFRTRLVGGRCFFLDADNRCRIQTELTYQDKPAVCRAFPLAVLDVNNVRYARLSYWCPTVAEDLGKPLDQQARWIRDVTKTAGKRSGPLSLDGRHSLSAPEFRSAHRTLLHWLERSDLPIEARLEGAARQVDPSCAAGEAAAGRRILSLYLLEDRAAGRWSGVRRTLAIQAFFRAGLPLHSRAMSASSTWRTARRVRWDDAGEIRQRVARYLATKVTSHRYVAGDASLQAGVNLLAVAFGIATLLARLRAASQGRPSCSDEDVRLGLGAADLLVVEHVGRLAPGLDRLRQQALEGASAALDVLSAVAGRDAG